MSVSRKTAAAVAVLIVAGFWGFAAGAQERRPRFELTPHAGYRVGGTFEQEGAGDDVDLEESAAQGILFNVRASAVTQWEVLYARQETRLETAGVLPVKSSFDIDIQYLHFGGTYLFDGLVARPFLALTVGMSHFAPGLDGESGETYFSGSLGGGMQFRADKRIGVRLEGRVFGTLIEDGSALFCRTGPDANVCALTGVGSLLYQWEARAGVVFRF